MRVDVIDEGYYVFIGADVFDGDELVSHRE